jgi:hypothetical protein
VPILAVLRVLFGIGLFGPGQQRIDLLLQARLGLVHTLVTHRFVLAGVGLGLGSLDGHMAQFHQSCLRAQQQSLCEQTRECKQITLAKLSDGSVVGVLVAGKITENHDLESARLNLARTVHTSRVTVQKHPNHHLRRIGRLTTPILLLIRLLDDAQIQRRNHIDQKPRQMALGKPIVKATGKHQRLVDRVRIEVLTHTSNLNQNSMHTLSAPSRIYARHAPRVERSFACL